MVSCGSLTVNGGGKFNHNPTAYNSLTLLQNLGPFNPAQLHKNFVSGDLYSDYIDLTSAIIMDHTGTYTLSVVNNYSGVSFAWTELNSSNSHLQYIIGQAMIPLASGSLSFTLTNTSAASVPIPASALLLGSGLESLFSITSKKRKTI